jgi:hypothetical protein
MPKRCLVSWRGSNDSLIVVIRLSLSEKVDPDRHWRDTRWRLASS